MADTGTQIASAYVQIIPSAKGIKNELSNLLDGDASSAGNKAGGLLGSNLASAAVKAIAAAGIGTIIKNTISSAVSEGAALQQSIGGIETLFGAGGAKSVEEYADAVGSTVDEVIDKYDSLVEAQDYVMSRAAEAYDSAGLSANDYMETVTGFAASLKQSTDSEMEAAKAADQAVIDMSDNANKMGTSMELIQNAYQGFAKQNYTMLDNLKLGRKTMAQYKPREFGENLCFC